MFCKERLSHLGKSIHLNNMMWPFEVSWYIFQIISAYSSLSAKPWHHQDLQGREVNHFTRSTNFLLAHKVVHVQVISGPWSYIQPYCSSVTWHLFISAVPLDVAALKKSLHHIYICVMQCKFLPMNTSIHIALRPTSHAALAFFQFILSHSAAINRTKSSWWPFLQD